MAICDISLYPCIKVIEWYHVLLDLYIIPKRVKVWHHFQCYFNGSKVPNLFDNYNLLSLPKNERNGPATCDFRQ